MDFIKKKAFILNYLGSLLFIVAIFLPIIKINNQTYAFIDNFLTLSIIIAILSTAAILLTALKQYRFTLIPIVANIGVAIYGIIEFFNIDGLKLAIELKYASYGISLIIYPIAAVISLLGGIITLLSVLSKKEKIKEEKVVKNESINEEPISEEQEIDQMFENVDIENDLEDPTVQIPLTNIINNTKPVDSNKPETVIENHVETEDVDIDDEKVKDESILFDQEVKTEETIKNLKNDIVPNSEIEVNPNTITTEPITNTPTNQNVTVESNNIVNDNELSNVPMSNLDDELIEFEEIKETNDSNNVDELIEFEEIKEEPVQLQVDTPQNNIIENNETNIIPDISEENLMVNNTQVEDKPKEEFMALNPSDIKITEKKPLFKRKEEKQEDPLEKIMNRNITATLGRKCQFCNTPLGDDERICPLCGRIN